MIKTQLNGLHLLLIVTLAAVILYTTKYWIIDGWLKKPRYRYYRVTRRIPELEDYVMDGRAIYRVNLRTKQLDIKFKEEWQEAFFTTFKDLEKGLYSGRMEEVDYESIHSQENR